MASSLAFQGRIQTTPLKGQVRDNSPPFELAASSVIIHSLLLTEMKIKRIQHTG